MAIFSASTTLANCLVLLVWGITPLSWTFLLAHLLSLTFHASVHSLSPFLASQLPHIPSSGIPRLARMVLLFYTFLEALFSLYYQFLISRSQRLLEPPVYSYDLLRTIMRRAMGTGMDSVYPRGGPPRKLANGRPHRPLEAGAAPGLQPRGSNARTQSPSSPPGTPLAGGDPWGSSFATPDPSRPASPSPLAPVSEPLAFDDPRAVDFRSHQVLWFGSCDWADIKKDNMREWLCWSLYGAERATVELWDREKLQGESGRWAFVDECLKLMEHRSGTGFAEGYNAALKERTLRLTLDPVRVTSRPLGLYVFVGLTTWMFKRIMIARGFKVMGSTKASRAEGVEFLVRVPPGWDPNETHSDTTRPVVFWHGLGIGLIQYSVMLNYLSAAPSALARPVLIPLQPSISMDLLHPNHLRHPSQDVMTSAFADAVQALGWRSCGLDVVGHSNGTIVAGWIVKRLPEIVRRLCLIDPVCFCLWEPHICFNFLYSTPSTGIEVLMRYFVGSELGVALSLQRNFNWASNILFPVDVPGFADPRRTAVFLAGRDSVLNAPRVRRYLLENGMSDADSTWVSDGGNGNGEGEERTREGDGKGRGGIVMSWEGAHGESLISGTGQFERIVRWLQGEGLGPPKAG